MGIPLNRQQEAFNGHQRGFSLLEQMIAVVLVVVGSVCALETIVFCLVTLQVSEDKWEEDIARWNEAQVELLENEAKNELEEESGFETPN